jgi:hypothetical protein
VRSSYHINKAQRAEAAQSSSEHSPTQAAAAAAAAADTTAGRAAAAASTSGLINALPVTNRGSSSSMSSGSSSKAVRRPVASLNPGFTYPANPMLLHRQQLQQQQLALLWAAVKFKIAPVTDPAWMNNCLLAFRRKIRSLGPEATVGLLMAAVEAQQCTAAAAASAAIRVDAAGASPEAVRHRSLRVMTALLITRFLQLLPRLRCVELLTGVTALAAAGTTTTAPADVSSDICCRSSTAMEAMTSPHQQQQQQHSVPAANLVYVLRPGQQQVLLTAIQHQLPYVPPMQLPQLVSCMSKMSLTLSVTWVTEAWQCLAVKAVAGEGAGQTGQQWLLLAGAWQLLQCCCQQQQQQHLQQPAEANDRTHSSSSSSSSSSNQESRLGLSAAQHESAAVPVPAVPMARPVIRLLGTTALQALSGMVQKCTVGSSSSSSSSDQLQSGKALPTPADATAVTGTMSPTDVMLAGCVALRLSGTASMAALSPSGQAAATSDVIFPPREQQRQWHELAALVVLTQAGRGLTGASGLPPVAATPSPAWQQQQRQQQRQHRPLRQQKQQQHEQSVRQVQLQSLLVVLRAEMFSLGMKLLFAGQSREAPFHRQHQAAVQEEAFGPAPAGRAVPGGSAGWAQQLATKGLHLRFDSLLRQAFTAAMEQLPHEQQQQQQRQTAAAITSSASCSCDEAPPAAPPLPAQPDLPGAEPSAVGLELALATAAVGAAAAAADGAGCGAPAVAVHGSSSPAASSSEHVVVLPVMSSALDFQFVRLLKDVLRRATRSSRSSSGGGSSQCSDSGSSECSINGKASSNMY